MGRLYLSISHLLTSLCTCGIVVWRIDLSRNKRTKVNPSNNEKENEAHSISGVEGHKRTTKTFCIARAGELSIWTPDSDAGAWERANTGLFYRIGAKIDSFFWEDGPDKYGFEIRDGQPDMSFEIAEAMKRRRHIVVEAGVGIGKSFAYLVPTLLYNNEKHPSGISRCRTSLKISRSDWMNPCMSRTNSCTGLNARRKMWTFCLLLKIRAAFWKIFTLTAVSALSWLRQRLPQQKTRIWNRNTLILSAIRVSLLIQGYYQIQNRRRFLMTSMPWFTIVTWEWKVLQRFHSKIDVFLVPSIVLDGPKNLKKSPKKPWQTGGIVRPISSIESWRNRPL